MNFAYNVEALIYSYLAWNEMLSTDTSHAPHIKCLGTEASTSIKFIVIEDDDNRQNYSFVK
jgi:hypothetical protein